MEKTSQPSIQNVSPDSIMEMIGGYERAAVIGAAIDLELFTAIGEGAGTATDIARRCQASERGVRILCDYLVSTGQLQKSGDRYSLAEDAAAFLDKRSPMYLGSVANFLQSSHMRGNYDTLVDNVRRGGAAAGSNSVSPEHPMWVTFAKSMAPMMAPVAKAVASQLPPGLGKVLDIAAGHGLYGIAVAQQQPQARIVALDWQNVLEYAKENARRLGVESRYELLPGDAFEVQFGGDYDAALVPNFLHHFDAETNKRFLMKIYGALRTGGVVAVVEFVPNEDRVSPPWPAQFALKMLAGTPSGDAYTFPEIGEMLSSAGFSNFRRIDLRPTPQTLVLATKS